MPLRDWSSVALGVSRPWRVERFGGNAAHKRRTVFVGTEEVARQVWQKYHAAMRQGTVDLIDPNGKIIRSWAPRARTRLA